MERKKRKRKWIFLIVVGIVIELITLYHLEKPRANRIESSGNQTVREFLWGKSIVVPQKILKADRSFSEVVIVYGPPPRKWKKGENQMIWITGNNPDSQISFLFKKLYPQR